MIYCYRQRTMCNLETITCDLTCYIKVAKSQTIHPRHTHTNKKITRCQQQKEETFI